MRNEGVARHHRSPGGQFAIALDRARAAVSLLDALATVLAALIVVPVAIVMLQVFAPATDTWAHLVATVLPEYVRNTIYLLVGVGFGVGVIGTLTAWVVTTYRFPGRQTLEWALVLPLAMPAYVVAYAYTDALQFSGPVQTWLRELMGWRAREYWFPDIRSVGGAITLFILTLYPYVYLLARAAFLEQSMATLEASRLLGVSRWGSFLRVGLPLARPAIVGGIALAMMETLADFGTVSYFAVPTFSTGIYRAWFSLGDFHAAAQLAMIMLGFVLAIIAFERALRGRARVHNAGNRGAAGSVPLQSRSAWLATLVCGLPVLLGFAVPAAMLVRMAIARGDPQFGPRFLELVFNSFSLAGVAAIVAAAMALLVAYAARVTHLRLVVAATKIAGIGYAVPGHVIAVGILIPLAALDNALVGWLKAQFGIAAGLLLTGSIAALVYAYTVRFLGVALQTINAGMAKITPSMDDAARSLGLAPAATLRRVHLPMLRRSVFTAALLVFVEVMKELPATFVLRPFNFDTLAVQAYNLAADERLSEAATASLVIVMVGVLPIIILSRAIRRTRRE
ncbi:MAG TPA: iron ABC transporter permease [Casimicrobiaceae bacterium]|nr:iron ABC transporter permease [Casimicrobiaceae bacterium]